MIVWEKYFVYGDTGSHTLLNREPSRIHLLLYAWKPDSFARELQEATYLLHGRQIIFYGVKANRILLYLGHREPSFYG